MEERALNALGRNRPQLDALARNLLEHETLSTEDVDRILREAGRPESDASYLARHSGDLTERRAEAADRSGSGIAGIRSQLLLRAVRNTG